MPHIVIEHSSNLTQSIANTKLAAILHKTVVDSGLFSPEAVKARSIAFDDYILPEGKENFLHVTISILEGRNEEKRTRLADALFQALKSNVPESHSSSVNIHEMCKATYRK